MNSVATESLGSDINHETQSLLSALKILCQILQLTDDPHTFERSAQSAPSETPKKAFTSVGERGEKFYGSLRLHIAIARDLVADPKILIFDEATSALDYETESAILRKLLEIVKGRTVIMIAHRLNCMPLCDRVVVMEHGEIIEAGCHDDLVKGAGQYKELWELQAS